MEPNEYKCARCHGVFSKETDGWSDEQAKEETKDIFGFLPGDNDLAIVCDDCWKELGFAS